MVISSYRYQHSSHLLTSNIHSIRVGTSISVFLVYTLGQSSWYFAPSFGIAAIFRFLLFLQGFHNWTLNPFHNLITINKASTYGEQKVLYYYIHCSHISRFTTIVQNYLIKYLITDPFQIPRVKLEY